MEKLLRRLNHTWQKVRRDRHLAALYFQLDDPEYRLYDLYFAAYGWDKTYKETYGTVEFPDREIGNILSWSPAKVCRTRNRLLKKGIISVRNENENIYKILPPPSLPDNLTALEEKIAWMQKLISPLQQAGASPKQDVAPVQQTQGYSGDSSIVSYKDQYSLVYPKKLLIKQEVRTEEEYQQMYQENPNFPIPEDMRWIDENLKEVIEVSAENEKQVVDLYFDGDWQRYQRSLITSPLRANIESA